MEMFKIFGPGWNVGELESAPPPQTLVSGPECIIGAFPFLESKKDAQNAPPNLTYQGVLPHTHPGNKFIASHLSDEFVWVKNWYFDNPSPLLAK